MAKKTSSKPRAEKGSSFMVSSPHRQVVDAVSDQVPSVWFNKKDSDKDSNNRYQTHIMGNFRCNNKVCPSGGWASKKVAILIRGYPKNGYNAVVFNQRCKSCGLLGYLMMDTESYVDRVAYRIKKWAGIRVEQQPYNRKKGLPHESSLCEGCKRGVCHQTDD